MKGVVRPHATPTKRKARVQRMGLAESLGVEVGALGSMVVWLCCGFLYLSAVLWKGGGW